MIVAGMLGFQDYGDFSEYFGPRWNYLLKNVIGWVPIPFRFYKDDFASGVAVRTLRAYADTPKQYLDEKERARIDEAACELWRRLEDALGENSEKLVALRSRIAGDNTGDGPATADGLQAGLFDDPYIPF